MARKEKRYTLGDIKRQRQKLSKRIEQKEQRLRRQWHDLVDPPEVNDAFHLWANRAEAAFSLYDGFMTGYKLLRTLGFSFGRKKKTRK